MTKEHISLSGDAYLRIFIAGKKACICGIKIRFWDSIFLLGQIVKVVNKIFTDMLVFFSTFVYGGKHNMYDKMLKNNYIDHWLQVGVFQWHDIWKEMQPITFTRCPRIIQFE